MVASARIAAVQESFNRIRIRQLAPISLFTAIFGPTRISPEPRLHLLSKV